jgi:hypothetical protein
MLTLLGYTFVGLSALRLLALGLGASAALTALYLLRERRAHMVVSFAPLWMEAVAMQRQERLGRRFRRVLSWLLQMTILWLIVAAVGDPRPARLSEGGRSIVVLVDGSASMAAREGAGTRHDAARALALRFVGALDRQDRVMVAGFGRTVAVESGFEADPGRVRAAIARLQPAEEPADLAGALAFAGAVLRGRPHPEIMLVGDGVYEESGLGALAGSAIALRALRAGTPADNLGVVGFSARRRLSDPGTIDAQVVVRNFGARPRRASVEIRGGERRLVGRAALSLGAGERASRSFSWVAGQEAALEAELRAEDPAGGDALPLDDRAYAVVVERPQRRVLVAGAPDLYLDGALLSFGKAVLAERVAPAGLEARRAEWGAFDAVILDGVAPAPAPSAGRFLYLDPAGPGGPFAEKGKISDPVPSDFNRAHPLLRHLALADLNIREARRWTLEPGDVAVAASLGAPLIVARARPGLRVVALSFDLRRSDLPLRPTLPLLLANALDWLAGAGPGEEGASYPTGALARVPVPRGTHAVRVVAPGGATAARAAVGGAVEIPLPRSGHYRVIPEGEPSAAFTIAANTFDEAESDTARPPPAGFVRIAGAAPARPGSPARRLGLGGMALLGAAALLLLEWWTHHRRWTV